MVNMIENELTLNAIIAAMDEHLRSFKVEIKNEIMAEVDKRFDLLERKISEGFRQQGILMEAMQGDIDTLVDGQEIIQERIDRAIIGVYQD